MAEGGMRPGGFEAAEPSSASIDWGQKGRVPAARGASNDMAAVRHAPGEEPSRALRMRQHIPGQLSLSWLALTMLTHMLHTMRQGCECSSQAGAPNNPKS